MRKSTEMTLLSTVLQVFAGFCRFMQVFSAVSEVAR